MDGDPVQTALSSIRAAVDGLNAVALWSRSREQAMTDTREAFAVLQQVHAVYLAMVTDLGGRPLPEGLTTKAFLRSTLHRTTGQASGDVRAAMNRLPKTREAFTAGEISREHVDVIVRTAARIPDEVKYSEVSKLPELDLGEGETVTVVDAVDILLAHHAHRYDSHTLQGLAKALLSVLLPDADDGFDPNAYDRRSETHIRDENGMVHGTFNLDAPTGADFAAAMDHFSAPLPKRTETAEDGSTVEILDARTPPQRRADALGIMARMAMSAVAAGTKGGEPPRIVIYTGLEDLHDVHCANPDHHPGTPSPAETPTASAPASAPESTPAAPTPAQTATGRMHGATDTHLGAIGPALLARFSCDAVLQAALMHPTGAILDLGRDARTISPAQRRALTARDRGCIVPGCGAPPTWCDGHHVKFWSKGGLTNIDELALLCGHHHSEVHLGLLEVKMINDVPWVRPPEHIDPQRRWLRNTYHHDVDQARDLGARLRPSSPPGGSAQPDAA
jgi:hypothetical protein